MLREAELIRRTKETEVFIKLNIDGSGSSNISTGINFLNHMLSLLAKHGNMDIEIQAKGDLEVDNHHTVEDIGIVLGQVFKRALGDKTSIRRYGEAFTPMDEALTMVVIDISGRGFLHYNLALRREYVGDFEIETLEEFLRAFAINSGITLHVNLLYGRNAHHIIESIFKGLGIAINKGVYIDDKIRGVMSTKGVI